MRWMFVCALAVVMACGGTKDDAGPGSGGGGGNGSTGGSSGGSGGSGSDTTTEIRLRYPTTQTQSPMTQDVADIINAIADNDGSRRATMFMKVGDEVSASAFNLSCFASTVTADVQLDGRTDLQATITALKNANFSGPSTCTETWCNGATTAFNRKSYVAADGAIAATPLAGTTKPLDTEDNATNARFALIEYGTNDSTTILTKADLSAFVTFYASMAAIADNTIDRGIVPIFLTIPPKATTQPDYRNVTTINALVRLVAQSRGVPLADFYRTVVGLTNYGLSDGINPATAPSTGYTVPGCDFKADGLTGGVNQRNLLQITALDRVRGVLAGDDPLDSDNGSVSGSGTVAAPYVIDSLPFVDSVAKADNATSVYALHVDAEQSYRFVVVDPADGSGVSFTVKEGASTKVQGTAIAQVDLEAGDYVLTVSGASYAIAVLALDSTDPTLQN